MPPESVQDEVFRPGSDDEPVPPGARGRSSFEKYQAETAKPGTPGDTDSVQWTEAAPRRASLLDELIAFKPDEVGGKLILWWSNPGAGKSFALRSLAKAWSPWCDIHYVTDPEEMLRNPPYLMSTILGSDEFDPEQPRDELDGEMRWRLFIFEDADEFITKDAKERSGQALSRLLNITDGLLGQGLGVLILITTNEPVARLHPAVLGHDSPPRQARNGPSERAEKLGRRRGNMGSALTGANTSYGLKAQCTPIYSTAFESTSLCTHFR